MKMFPLLYCAFALLLFISSCSTYQYVSPLPAVPQFEKAGEIQASAAIGLNHNEYQVSASVLPFLGFTYTEFNSHLAKDKSKIQSGTLHLFHKLGELPAFVNLSLGYDKGAIRTGSVNYPSAMPPSKQYFTAKYETKKIGLGVHGHFEADYPIRVGLDVLYQQVMFSELSKYFRNNYSGSTTRTLLAQKQHMDLVTPVLSFTISGNGHHRFFYRQSFGLDIPISSNPLSAVTFWDSGNVSWHSGSYSTTVRPLMNSFFLSGSVGFCFDSQHAFYAVKSFYQK